MSEIIHGYEADIYQGLWKRPQTLGAPRLWSSVWIAIGLYAGLITLTLAGVKWVLLPIVMWGIGQGVLIGLTLWDADWDQILMAHLTRRTPPYYHAG